MEQIKLSLRHFSVKLMETMFLLIKRHSYLHRDYSQQKKVLSITVIMYRDALELTKLSHFRQ